MMKRLLTIGILAALGLGGAGCLRVAEPAAATPTIAAATASQTATAPAVPSATAVQTGTSTAAAETATPAAGPAVPTAVASPVPAAMCSPLAGYTFDDVLQIVSNPFVAPRVGKDDGHHGIDLAHYAFGDRTTIAGVPVAAVFGGRVAAAIAGSWPYGHFVIVETPPEELPAWFAGTAGLQDGQSAYHLYAHLEEPPGLAVGDALQCGDTFGLVGNSGWSGNYHLHFEIRLGPPGAVFESMSYYLTTTTEEERENYERWRFGGGEFVAVDPVGLIESAVP